MCFRTHACALSFNLSPFDLHDLHQVVRGGGNSTNQLRHSLRDLAMVSRLPIVQRENMSSHVPFLRAQRPRVEETMGLFRARLAEEDGS